MNEWKTYKLGEVLQIKYGKDHKHISEGDIPIYGSGGIMRYGNQSISQGPTIMIPRKGSLNNIMFSETPFWTVDTMFWSIIDTSIVNPLFLYYAICKKDFASLNVGSAVPSLTVPIIEDIEVSLPSLSIQNKIVEILKSLDDKIGNNRRVNDNLEQQAQALFEECFINNSTFITTCNKAYLTDIASYLNGLAMQKFRPKEGEIGIPVLKIKELGQGGCDALSDLCSSSIDKRYVINDGDIIFSWSGTLLVDVWCGGTCGLNQHLFKVSSDKYPQWFIYYWTKYHLAKFIRIAKDKAVTMGHIKRGDLEVSEVLIPESSELEKLNNMIAPIFKAITANRIENRNLATLRDTLLPKLMSGELSVNDVLVD